MLRKLGFKTTTKSFKILFVTASKNIPSLRYEFKYNLYDLSSTQSLFGIYSRVIVAKSGCPVLGQSDVNSGAVWIIV